MRDWTATRLLGSDTVITDTHTREARQMKKAVGERNAANGQSSDRRGEERRGEGVV